MSMKSLRLHTEHSSLASGLEARAILELMFLTRLLSSCRRKSILSSNWRGDKQDQQFGRWARRPHLWSNGSNTKHPSLEWKKGLFFQPLESYTTGFIAFLLV